MHSHRRFPIWPAALLLTAAGLVLSVGPLTPWVLSRLLRSAWDGKSSFSSARLSWPAVLEVRGLRLSAKDVEIQADRVRLEGHLPDLRHWDLRANAATNIPRLVKAVRIEGLRAANADRELKDGLLTYERPRGELRIGRITAGKVSLDEIEGDLSLGPDGRLRIRPLRARFLEHPLEAEAEIMLSDGTYNLRSAIRLLPVQSLIRFMEWEKKLAVTGQADGHARLDGSPKGLTRLDGSFMASDGGGNIEILDPEFLQRIAASSKQPVEIVEATFKNYRYNDGQALFHMEGPNLKLSLNLDGDAGKRDLEVELHDLFKR